MGPNTCDETEKYFQQLHAQLKEAYGIAEKARLKKLDPSLDVEIKMAADVAARVEGIVGPPNIANLIREFESSGESRERIAYYIVKKIVNREIDLPPEIKNNKVRLIEQAIRTGVGILTEGVLVAPTEGISKVEIRNNPDGSEYLAIFFAGPIRSAGGTVAALAVVLGDVARRELKIGDFRPTDTQIERYVEEIGIYGTRSAHLQYRPPDDDIRHIVKNCPVCIDGDPTEEEEVAVYRDIDGVSTNRIRSGIALVICEGIAQKAAKVSKYTKKINLDWSWLEPIIKVASKESGFLPKPDYRFLEESVAGRVIFSYPSKKGGWRLRYGRTRATGIMSKAIHPASMYILDSFLAVGTQMKIERPGKSCVVTPCDTIEGPVVKLIDGSVVRVETVQQAKELDGKIQKILFLGDILISVGDFLKSNHPLMPSAWCEEWFEQEAKKQGVQNIKHNLTAGEAVALCRKKGIPLHPRYTYFWHNITHEQLKELAEWLKTGTPHYGLFRLDSFELESSPTKAVLEELCVPHIVEQGKIKIPGEDAYALLKTMGIMVEKNITGEKFEALFDEKKPILELLSEISGMKIMAKAPTYIGSRMGRPEKARERKMKKSVNVLFPVGTAIDKNANITKIYNKLKSRAEKEGRGIEVEIARLRCKACGGQTIYTECVCGGYAVQQTVCNVCHRYQKADECPECKVKTTKWDKRSINIVSLFEKALENCKVSIDEIGDIKGVEGLFSSSKIPERLEKGVLRAKHRIYVFRDGTSRFDATDVPLTHFKPKEIGTSIEKLKELGYSHDKNGKPLEEDEQIIPLKVQDIILSKNGAKYLFRVAKFIDELLEKVYGIAPYYRLEKEEDLVGHLVVGLSPHTSAAVLGRVIGFTDANVGFAHPYFHAAKRRNADGDEDSVILLLDALINFSLAFLPESRGGTMDAPLVLTTRIDPREIDDEVHTMEICKSYSLEFYLQTTKLASPSDANVEIVKKVLGKPEQYLSLEYTHETSCISIGPQITSYLQFKDMAEKIDAQFALQEKISAVEAADAAERLLLHHFLPDLYGNLRSFSQQNFRCIDCKIKYRRVPLSGKCNNCGGKLLLTVAKGGITKYLQHALDTINRYNLPLYLRQRLDLLKKDINSVFTEEASPQKGLAEFM
ncbi:MAG: DNA polymerase II large subunit [Candidatus Micrarchaeota archaeon]|nr:DNA polymerase II large subunit [Candidatus Micrarchaeota archaeon]